MNILVTTIRIHECKIFQMIQRKGKRESDREKREKGRERIKKEKCGEREGEGGERERERERERRGREKEFQPAATQRMPPPDSARSTGSRPSSRHRTTPEPSPGQRSDR